MSAARDNAAGRIYDPVFIFMVASMILAIISSIALRTVVSGAGPASAHAADSSGGDAPDQLPGYRPAPRTHSGVK